MKNYKVIVCGTLFGQVYLSAFREKFPNFELAGILARGGERSVRVAEEFAVPLYTDVANLPDDIDIACVVVSSSLIGGAGTDLALALLNRGIHVIQEHPVYETDVAACLRAARENNAQYLVNTHYPTVPAAEYFIDYCQAIAKNQQPLFIEVTCGVQVVCGMLDILSRALGKVSPYEFYDSETIRETIAKKTSFRPPYSVIQGVFSGAPIIVHLQNQLDPTEPDNHFHIMHRITVGFPSGNLVLANTHGPVQWNRQFHIPRKTENNEENIEKNELNTHYFESALCEEVYPGNASLEDVLNDHWSQSIRTTLHQLRDVIETPSPQVAQQLLARSQVWKALMSCVGNPESISATAPPAVEPLVSEWLVDKKS